MKAVVGVAPRLFLVAGGYRPVLAAAKCIISGLLKHALRTRQTLFRFE